MFNYDFKRERKTFSKISAPSPYFMKEESDSPETYKSHQSLLSRKHRKAPPSLYKVVLLNDDFTPMDFVIHILGRFFNQSRDNAEKIVLHIHNQGLAEAGIFSHEIAETKVYLVNKYARKYKFPLKCLLEKIQ